MKYFDKAPHLTTILLVTYQPNYTVLLPRTSAYIRYNIICVSQSHYVIWVSGILCSL